MLKYGKLSILIILMGLLWACTNSTEEPSSEALGADAVVDSMNYTSINIHNDTTWAAIEKIWFKQTFIPCKEGAKIKISCLGCEGILLNAVFFINLNGTLEEYKLQNSRFCEEPALEACLMDYFRSIQFPEKYKNTSFQVRLGSLLKC